MSTVQVNSGHKISTLYGGVKLNIGAIARQTGINVATLRKWEARYGFPVPRRTAGGQRDYVAETVDQLLEIRRMVANSIRPGEAIKTFLSAQQSLEETSQKVVPPSQTKISRCIDLLLQENSMALQGWLQERRYRLSTIDFVEQEAAPLAREVGALWASGQLSVYAEHVFSDVLNHILRMPHPQERTNQAPPRILLSALAGERHTLGLDMARAVLASLGEASITIAVDLPTADIVAAASSYRATVVGITASLAYPPKLLAANIAELRQKLPESIRLWAGGAGVVRLPRLPEGVIQITNMFDLRANWESLPDLPHPERALL